jgi:hypothetical protein
MSKLSSSYYPPRARWYSRIFNLRLAARHQLALDRLYIPNEMTLGGLLASFFVPGLAVYLRGPRLWGKAALAASAFLFLCFIVWLGYPFGNYAFGLMLSIHATGFVYYCSPYLLGKDFGFRILFTIAILIAVGMTVYTPLRGVIQNHWLMPLRVNGNVVVVEKFTAAKAVKRGDWIAYHLSEASNSGDDAWIQYRAGVGFGPVLAVAGDRVEFWTNAFNIDGNPQGLLPHMPTSGNFMVPEKQWFIWPSYSISGQGNENRISSTMLQMANVSESQYVGKPFKRWFWRKQILP